jgi:hypothetical protein
MPRMMGFDVRDNRIPGRRISWACYALLGDVHHRDSQRIDTLD